GGRVAGQRIEGGLDSDLDRARERRAPQVRRVLEDVETLGAERRSWVPTDRGHGSRVVETFRGTVGRVDDGDGRGAARARPCRHEQDQREDERARAIHRSGAPEAVGADSNGWTSSRGAQSKTGRPSGPIRATT